MIDDQHILALPNGYRLGKYAFKGVLGSGGFGITYLAEDTSLDRKVAIKEMLPNDFATRLDGTTVVAKTRSDKTNLDWARARFLDEGKALAACDHPNVIDVYEMIEANGTAYMVTQFQEGCNLETWFQNLQRRPTEKELRDILVPLLAGLEKVHRAGFLHRDIKPENIYITLDGRPVLLDFGSARQAIRGRSMVMTSIVTPGYAPFEQYHEDGHQGPWTDLYALGAVLYRGITGKKPPESIRRLADDTCESLATTYVGHYSTQFLSSIDRTLQLKETARPQSVAAWRDLLGTDSIPESRSVVAASNGKKPSTTVSADSTLAAESERTGRVETEKSGTINITLPAFVLQRRALVATVAVAVIGAFIGVGYLVVGRHGGQDSTNNQTGPQNQVTPAITPVDQNKLTGGPSPTPILDKLTPPAQNLVADNSHLIPAAHQPTPAPSVIVTPAPMAAVTPSASPVPGPIAVATPPTTFAQIDPKLVGKWETKHLHKDGGAETWEFQADGKYIFSGAQDESGTLTAGDGNILEYPSATSQPQPLTYTFVGDKLVTKTPDGLETIWAKRREEDGLGSRRQIRRREEGPRDSETPVWKKVIKAIPRLPWQH
jgi:serine/threonine protein kinase